MHRKQERIAENYSTISGNPSKPETPLNRTFYPVPTRFGLEGFHCRRKNRVYEQHTRQDHPIGNT